MSAIGPPRSSTRPNTSGAARGENEVRYFTPGGATIGIATRVGSEIVLKTIDGKTVQRVRAR